MTLSWGTADMAANLALVTPHRNAAVLGCGAVGLATARLLQDRGFEVAIYAKDLPPNTTSNVAAAMFGVTEVVSQAHHSGPIAVFNLARDRAVENRPWRMTPTNEPMVHKVRKRAVLTDADTFIVSFSAHSGSRSMPASKAATTSPG